RGAWVAIALLATTVAVDVAPFWGSDFGGIPSMVPAFAITGAMLLGIRPRIRARTALLLAAASVAVLTIAVGLDLSRPKDQQTHVGRLVDSIRANGLSKLWSVIGRKLDQNLTTLTSSDWRWVLLLVLTFVAYLALSRQAWLARLVARIPELRAALVGFAAL